MTKPNTSENEKNTLYTKTGLVIKVMPKEPNKDIVNKIMKILAEENVEVI